MIKPAIRISNIKHATILGGPCFNKIPNIFGSVVCRKKNAKRKTEEIDNDKYEDKLRPA